jgi:uncharacterized protein
MPTSSRDRDERGRPKNARPRDELGRPLPRGAGGGLQEEPPAGSPEEALDRGIDHFNAGRYFQAHEAWEEAWHGAPENERDFWQGITQVAVGLTHRLRGNAHGAVTLLKRGARRLSPYGAKYKGIESGALGSFAADAAERIERGGVEAPVEPPALKREPE